VAVRTSAGVAWADLAAERPALRRQDDAGGCLHYGLDGLAGDPAGGLWLPAGELGSLHLPADAP
jgi:hypothetical protein